MRALPRLRETGAGVMKAEAMEAVAKRATVMRAILKILT